MCAHVAVNNVTCNSVYINRFDKLLSYTSGIHHCSDVVYIADALLLET